MMLGLLERLRFPRRAGDQRRTDTTKTCPRFTMGTPAADLALNRSLYKDSIAGPWQDRHHLTSGP